MWPQHDWRAQLDDLCQASSIAPLESPSLQPNSGGIREPTTVDIASKVATKSCSVTGTRSSVSFSREPHDVAGQNCKTFLRKEPSTRPSLCSNRCRTSKATT